MHIPNAELLGGQAMRNLSTSWGQALAGFVELVGWLIHAVLGGAGGTGWCWTILSGWAV